MELFLQLVVLGFTVIVWTLARRDLTRLAAQARTQESGEMERLRASVEELTVDLERRAEAAEVRLSARIAQAQALRPPASAPATEAPPAAAGEVDDRYAPVLALAADGVTDPTEIARRTGFGRGEVEMLLNLRARRAP